MLKISYAGCLGLSLAMLAHFTLKMCVAGGNRQKITKKSLLPGVKVIQGHRRWHQWKA